MKSADDRSNRYKVHRKQGDSLARVIRAMFVVLFSIILTVFVPGLVAAHDRVFFDTDIRAKLPKSASLSLKAYEDDKSKTDSSILDLRKNLSGLHDPSQQKDLDFYSRLIEQREKFAAQTKPPIYMIGFFLSPQMLLWPAIYSSLGCLLVCFDRPRRDFLTSNQRLKWLSLGFLIYVYYEWPLWARNFLLGSHGRTVYGYTNVDIDVSSFLVQEATIAGFAFLLASVWLRWCAVLKDNEENSKKASHGNILDFEALGDLHKIFANWIVTSIVLGFGFAYFTSFFWNLVAGYHDQRYILSAFLAHSLWIFTWAFISLPLVKSWILLREKRLDAIEALLLATNSAPGAVEQVNLDTIEKVESLAGVKLSFAGIGATISLLLPIVQLFIHKS